MDHSQFKANQTAAVYVADGLDSSTLEAFEMHMMGCQECLEDVETWRAIKINIPAKVRTLSTAATIGRRLRQASTWRMAASFLAVAMLGATGGWFGSQSRGPAFSSEREVFSNVLATERGDPSECMPVKLSPATQLAFVRVAGIAPDRKLVLVNSDQHDLPTDTYSVNSQPDGSRVLRLDAPNLVNRAVHLETRGADGSSEPVGCITGELTAP